MKLEELYNVVGAILIRHAPKGFVKAWIDAEIHDDHSKETWDYINEAGAENWWHIADNKEGIELTRALRAIRDQMFEQTGDKWKKVRFTVNKDLTFNAEFEYE